MSDLSDFEPISSTFELKKHALGMFLKSSKTQILRNSFDYKLVIFRVKKTKTPVNTGAKRRKLSVSTTDCSQTNLLPQPQRNPY